MGNSSIALWLFEKGADPEIPEKQCEIKGKVAHLLGDYFLAQDNVAKAHASFQQAQRSYGATITAVKAQLTNVKLDEGATVFGQVLAMAALDAAAGYGGRIQSRQLAQIGALRNAQRSGGGIKAYSAYLNKYNRDYLPTYTSVSLVPPEPLPPGASFEQSKAYYKAKIKHYEDLKFFIDKALVCFDSKTNIADLHACIDELSTKGFPQEGAAKQN